MTLELTCRTCGRPYTPTADDLRRGPEVYHRCPACRGAADAGAGETEDPEVRSDG